MATLASNYLTLADWAKRFGDGDSPEPVGEILSQTNEVLTDMIWAEGNLPTGHKVSVRTGLPSATWRTFYQGAQPTKSTTAQITDTCGMLETYSVIDRDLADLNGNTAEFRLSEDYGFIEGMNQQMASALFYSSTATTPAQIHGLAPRYNTVSTATAQTATNVIDAGGTGSNLTSIWLVLWGKASVYGIFPKGSRAGLFSEDVTTSAPVSDGNGGYYQAYQTKYQWKPGLTVKDWRYVVRIANVDTTTNAGGLQSTTPINLNRLLIRAKNRIPNLKMGKPVFYMSRAVRTWAEVQALEKANMAFQMTSDAQGGPFVSFQGIPCRLVDQLLNTETQVV
jgi:hypothetical protein